MLEASVLNGLTRLSIEIGSSKSRTDDDFADRINHSYSTTVLMLCTLVVLGRQFIGTPISCWTPNEFTGAQVEYATLTCWVTSTYFISPDLAQIPSDLNERRKKSIHYYQWVPFMLMLQAAMFSIPCIVWRLFNWQSRFHLWTIMDLASKVGDLKESVHSTVDNLQYIVRHMEDALIVRHSRKRSRPNKSSTTTDHTLVESSGFGGGHRWFAKDNSQYSLLPITVSHKSRIPGPRPCSPQSNGYLVGLYLIVKVLYIFNSTGQLFLLARFLGQKSVFYGPQLLVELILGSSWFISGNFPRVAFCDFDMRRMGSNYHRYTLQCALAINMFNEKIFLFLWFWLVCITVLNLHSFFKWCCRSTFKFNRVSFVQNLLFNQTEWIKNPDSSQSSVSHENRQIKPQLDTDSSSNQYASNNHTSLILTDVDKKASTFFTEHILGQDGVFVLRLVSLNIGPHIASKIAHLIWDRYKQVHNPPTQDNNSQRNEQQTSPPIPVRAAPPIGVRRRTNSTFPSVLASELLRAKAKRACLKFNAKRKIKLGSLYNSDDSRLHQSGVRLNRDDDDDNDNYDPCDLGGGIDNSKFDNLV